MGSRTVWSGGALTVVTSESLDEGREDPRLHELVVDDLGLGRLAAVVGEGSVAIRELPSDRAVSDRDSRRSSENHSSLLHNVGTDVRPAGKGDQAIDHEARWRLNSHGAVRELVVRGTGESTRVGVDLGVGGEEVDVGDLDFVELQDTESVARVSQDRHSLNGSVDNSRGELHCRSRGILPWVRYP